MAAKKDPAIGVIAFFETAPIESATTVLAICRGILSRRQPAKTKRAKPAPVPDVEAGALRKSS